MAGKDKEIINITPTEILPADLANMMEVEGERRKLVKQFISNHMVKDVDYGEISIGGRKSKPSLFKPGSEKFLSLFKLTATFKKDGETWDMAGSVPGLFCYVCEIRTSRGDVVGEGRGAANLSEKSNWTVNNAVKIAEKRAQIDAVLRMGALSDFFTQDVEDMAGAIPAPKTSYTRVHIQHPEDEPEVRQLPIQDNKEAEDKKKITAQKREIKRLLDECSDVPLKHPDDFKSACLRLTGLTLDAWNYEQIIERLKHYGTN